MLDTDKSTQAQSDIALDKSFALGKLTPRDFHLLVYPSNSSMTALQANDVNVLKLWNEGLQCEEETLGDAPLQAMVDALGTKVLTSIEYSTCSMVSVEEANSST